MGRKGNPLENLPETLFPIGGLREGFGTDPGLGLGVTNPAHTGAGGTSGYRRLLHDVAIIYWTLIAQPTAQGHLSASH